MKEGSIFGDYGFRICIIGMSLCLIALLILNHDPLVEQQARGKSIMNWIDSQTDCKYLRIYDTNLGIHDKWFKDSTDNELIKKMEELKC